MPKGRPPKVPGPDPVPERQHQTIAEFFEARASDDSICTVLRYTETGGLEFVCQGPHTAIDEAFVQERYGGGKYQFKLREQSGKYIASSTQYLAEPLAGLAPPAGPEVPDLYRSQFDLMQGQLARQQEMVIHLIDKQAAAPAAPQNDMVKIIEAMSALRNLADPGAQIKNIVSALTEGMRLGMRQSSGNGGGNGESKVDSILKVVDRVSELVPRFITRNPLGAPPAPNGPPAPGAPPAADPMQLLRGTIGYLKTKVSKDPALWADMIVDNLEESHWRMILELLEVPYDEIADRIGDPDLKREPYRSWFQKLLGELKNASQDSGAVDTGGETRDGRGPGDHGSNGPG